MSIFVGYCPNERYGACVAKVFAKMRFRGMRCVGLPRRRGPGERHQSQHSAVRKRQALGDVRGADAVEECADRVSDVIRSLVGGTPQARMGASRWLSLTVGPQPTLGTPARPNGRS